MPQGSISSFPPAWTWAIDELIPSFVKANYSPRESWKDKPFTAEDARFFFKGVNELSDLFTDERPSELPAYFNHPKFRSSYLLYFLPLQAAKFLTLFQMHPQAGRAALEHGRRTGKLVIADLGAGPATASIAWLLWAMNESQKPGAEPLPPIELHCLDTSHAILEDGRKLVEALAGNFPRLRGRVTVHTHVLPWWKGASVLPEETSLQLFGNVLNESALPSSVRSRGAGAAGVWSELLGKAKGGGALFVEPAFRRASQLLSKLRDEWFEAGILPAEPTAIWGPCLHAGKCPLAEGRDWCHHSVRAELPGKWFRIFSKGLGSERQWLKFSYLWSASTDSPAPSPAKNLRRVLSDPLNQRGPHGDMVLVCEPEVAARVRLPVGKRIFRGDLLKT